MGLRIDDTPVEDREPLEWLLGRLVCGRSVGSWIPDGFDRYARILHPAHLWEGTGDHVVDRSVPWSEVAAWSGKPLHRASSIHDLVRGADGTSWDRQGRNRPSEGQLEQPYLDRLTEALAEATSTAKRLWLLVWHGYGGPGTPLTRVYLARTHRLLQTRRLLSRLLMSRWHVAHDADLGRGEAVEISPSLTGSGRKYFLRRGSIEASSDDRDWPVFSQPPSFWWPADRAWFVSTDIDSSSTYVGGSSGLIDRLLADDLLEVFPANLDDPYDGPPYDPESRETK